MTNNQMIMDDVVHFFDFFSYAVSIKDTGVKIPCLIDKTHVDFDTKNTFIDFNDNEYSATLKTQDIKDNNIGEETEFELGDCIFRLNNIKTLGSGISSAQIIVLEGEVYGF